jgi:hypothetical protein
LSSFQQIKKSTIWGVQNMALLSISAAARVVKKSRGTIHNYLKTGRLSSVIDTDGHTKIDTAELLRVFGELSTDGAVQATVQTVEKVSKLNNFKQPQDGKLVEVLKEQLNAALEREKKLTDLLEREQQSRHELEQKILALPEGTAKKPWRFAWLFNRTRV